MLNWWNPRTSGSRSWGAANHTHKWRSNSSVFAISELVFAIYKVAWG